MHIKSVSRLSLLQTSRHFLLQVPELVLVKLLEPIRIGLLLIGFLLAVLVVVTSLFAEPRSGVPAEKKLETLNMNALDQISASLKAREISHSQRLRFSATALYQEPPTPSPQL